MARMALFIVCHLIYWSSINGSSSSRTLCHVLNRTWYWHHSTKWKMVMVMEIVSVLLFALSQGKWQNWILSRLKGRHETRTKIQETAHTHTIHIQKIIYLLSHSMVITITKRKGENKVKYINKIHSKEERKRQWKKCQNKMKWNRIK